MKNFPAELLTMKHKITFLASILFFVLFSLVVNAQTYVSLASGISKDVNNTNKSFYHIPVSLQWNPFKNKRTPFFFEFDYNIPFTCKSTGNAYTLNPSLPEKVTLQENIRSYIFIASMGVSIHLYTNKKWNSFYLNILLGICNQYFKIVYKNYDKANYEVLNPDIKLRSGGLVTSIAGIYNFKKSKHDMFLKVYLQSPPFQSTGDYVLSYKFVAPLQLTFGYKLFYNKRK